MFAARKKPADAFDDAPESGVRPRLPDAPEPYKAPRIWVSASAVLLVVSVCVGCVALAAGAFDVAAAMAPPAATSVLVLVLADSWDLAS